MVNGLLHLLAVVDGHMDICLAYHGCAHMQDYSTMCWLLWLPWVEVSCYHRCCCRCHGLVRVNVYKNAIKNASFPSLPNSRQLLHALAPHYTTLSEAAPLAVERPVHVITPDEEAAASNFLLVLHEYVSQLCGDLRLHTVVNVGMTKRTGVFMKDSLFESVQAKDRPFVKAFVETQMFAVYADGVISDYCES